MTVSTKSMEFSKVTQVTIIILLVANIGLTLVNMRGNNIETIINQIEATKVGGEENYSKLQTIMKSDAYKNNYAQNLDAMIMQMETSGKEENNIPGSEQQEPTIQTGTGESQDQTIIPELTGDG